MGRELRELGVVRGEERASARDFGEVLGDRPRERDAVEGAGPAADLVEDDEASVGRVEEDVRRLADVRAVYCQGRPPR